MQRLVWKYSQREMQRLVFKHSQLQGQWPWFLFDLLLLWQYNQLFWQLLQSFIGLLPLQVFWSLLLLFLFALSPTQFVVPGFRSPGPNFCFVHLARSLLLCLLNLSKIFKIRQYIKSFLQQIILMSREVSKWLI